MRFLIVFLAATSATAQSPLVRIANLSHPGSNTFQVGDKFEVSLTGAPFEQVSVRTTRESRTDWGPTIGSTDSSGRWSTTGQFDKSDFGSWGEVWTIGSKVASPVVHFQVTAPCLPGGRGFTSYFGAAMAIICDTADGEQRFSTAPSSASFRTPDGRVIAGHVREQTQEAYQMEILQTWIVTRHLSLKGGRGDKTAELVMSLIGVNALSEDEIGNVLVILRDAFEKPEILPPGARYPARTAKLLRQLATFVSDSGLQLQIAKTLEYVQTR